MTSEFISDLNWPVTTAKRIMTDTKSGDTEITLNGKTKVPLVWLVSMGVFILGLVGFGSASIFWAATLSAKVDTLLNAKGASEQTTLKHSADIRELQNKVVIWETYSGPWSKDMTLIERRVSDLERKVTPSK